MILHPFLACRPCARWRVQTRRSSPIGRADPLRFGMSRPKYRTTTLSRRDRSLVVPDSLTDQDYRVLVDFRQLLREFLAFSAKRAEEFGLAPQQHQALMAIRAEQPEATVGTVARRL